MWVMFLIGALISITIVFAVCKIGHKLYISMLRDERDFERESNEYEKNKR